MDIQAAAKEAIKEAMRPLEELCTFLGRGEGLITASSAVRECATIEEAQARMDALLTGWQAAYEGMRAARRVSE